MPQTITFDYTFSDEELQLIDKLIQTTKPLNAGPDWQPETREAYLKRVGFEQVRSRIAHFRDEYHRKNLEIVMAVFNTLPEATQLDLIDQLGLEYVGLELRPTASPPAA